MTVISLHARTRETEQLDEGVSEAETRRSLADLRFVNRVLGNRRRLWSVVRPYLDRSEAPRLLDVGCGSADIPAYFQRRCRRPLVAVGLDLKWRHLREVPPTIAAVAGDVTAIPFAPRSVDVVTASLFLHHFDDERLPALLRDLYDVARHALIVNDLERHAVPYWFGRFVFPFLFRSRVSVNDGLVSIRRGFTPMEIKRLFAEAGIPGARVTRSFPYRLIVVAEASENR